MFFEDDEELGMVVPEDEDIKSENEEMKHNSEEEEDCYNPEEVDLSDDDDEEEEEEDFYNPLEDTEEVDLSDEDDKEEDFYNPLEDEEEVDLSEVDNDDENNEEEDSYNPLEDEEEVDLSNDDEDDGVEEEDKPEELSEEEEEVEEEDAIPEPEVTDDDESEEISEEEEEEVTLISEPKKEEPKLSADSIEEFMNLDKSKYTIQHGNVLFKEIVVKKTMNEARKDTKAGLVKSIQEVGILTPIHVMMTKDYDEFLRSKSKESFRGPKYILLDGYRRVYNGIKVGLDGCYATIWNFSDKDYGEEFSLILSAILNKVQKHSIQETWDLIQKIQKAIPIANRTVDSLFQLENGDTNKLAEIMTCEYQDVIDSVLTGKKTISQGYNALKKLWDEEDQGSRDDKIGVSDFDKEHKVVGDATDSEAEGEEEEVAPRKVLSDDEVSEILGMTDKYNDDELMEAYDDMLKEPPTEVQDTKHRHPLDKDIKAETLRRDNYQCVCCGAGEGLPLKYALAILQSHHKISVGNGGPDTKENIVTVCPNCHTLIHTLLWNDGVFSKSDFEALPAKEKDRMRKILKYANMDYQAAKKKGKTSKDIKEDNKNYHTFKMPGTDLRENRKALEDSGIEVDSKVIENPEPLDLEDIDQNIE